VISDKAPIAVFAYKRPEHLKRVLYALAANPGAMESDLYVFSDAPKVVGDFEAVEAVRKVVNEVVGFKSVTKIFRDKNLGLAGSITTGVSSLCNSHGRVIVVEDDLVVSPHFLGYMNDALLKYKNEKRVISIHGYVYPVEAKDLPETFFIRGADCWGWATWQRGWEIYEPNGELLRDQIEKAGLEREFDFDGSYAYMKMLSDQISGKNDSWAIRWYASAFLADKLTLYPGRSLVTNIGADGSGTHIGSTTVFDIDFAEEEVLVKNIPLKEHHKARQFFSHYFRASNPTLLRRVKSRLSSLIRSNAHV
jgi:hypothetical protein